MYKILPLIICSFLLLSNLSFAEKINKNKTSINQSKQEKNMQKTFGMIKPSGLDKTNEIKSIIKLYGLKILKSKKVIMTEEKFNKLYYMHKEKPFFQDIKQSLLGKQVEVMILYGDNAIERYREAIIDIRTKYAISKTENVIHGSDTIEAANNEICIFFKC